MDFSSQIIPAIVLLVANLMSGHHSSIRWEVVTAIFGWTALIGLLMFLAAFTFWPAFCLLTALARDYERLLKPLFSWNR
mgnify:CR=1 FL=1